MMDSNNTTTQMYMLDVNLLLFIFNEYFAKLI